MKMESETDARGVSRIKNVGRRQVARRLAARAGNVRRAWLDDVPRTAEGGRRGWTSSPNKVARFRPSFLGAIASLGTLVS